MNTTNTNLNSQKSNQLSLSKSKRAKKFQYDPNGLQASVYRLSDTVFMLVPSMDELSIIYYSNNLIELLVGKDWNSISGCARCPLMQ